MLRGLVPDLLQSANAAEGALPQPFAGWGVARAHRECWHRVSHGAVQLQGVWAEQHQLTLPITWSLTFVCNRLEYVSVLFHTTKQSFFKYTLHSGSDFAYFKTILLVSPSKAALQEIRCICP